MKFLYKHFFLLFIFFSCSTPKKVGDKVPRGYSRINFLIVTEVFNKPIQNVQVSIPYGKCITNSSGKCSIDIPSEELGNTNDVSINRQDVGLFKRYNVKLFEKTTLTYDLKKGEIRTIQPKVNKRVTELQEFQKELDSIEDLLNVLEKSIDDYISKNGSSALSNYKININQKKDLVFKLRDDIRTLNSRYQYSIGTLKDEDIISIYENETSFEKLSRQIRIYSSKTKQLERAIENNIEVQPNYEIAYFYNSGKYIPIKRMPQINQEIEKFISILINFKKSKYSKYKDNELEVIIQAVGYTDGQKIGPDLASKIAPLCKKQNYNYEDLNYCLGYLRASGVLDILKNKISIKNFEQKIISEGSKLAMGNTRQNSKIRKCILSFAIYPKSLK